MSALCFVKLFSGFCSVRWIPGHSIVFPLVIMNSILPLFSTAVVSFGFPYTLVNKVSSEYSEPFSNDFRIAAATVFSMIVAFGLSQTAFSSSKSIAIIFWMVSFISDSLYPWSFSRETYLRGRPFGFMVSPLSGRVKVPPFLAGTCLAIRCSYDVKPPLLGFLKLD